MLLSSFFWSSYARDLMLTDGRPLIGRAYEFFQRGNLLLLGADQLLLLFDLCLLFLNRVDQNNADSVVLNTLDFTFVVVSYKQRFDGADLFGDQAHVSLVVVFPIERDRTETVEQTKARGKIVYVFLVAGCSSYKPRVETSPSSDKQNMIPHPQAAD